MRLVRRLPVSFLVLTAACADPTSRDAEQERTSARAQPIIAGKASAFDSVVLLAAEDTTNGGYAQGCSASLVARNLVMTARHCVAELNGIRVTDVPASLLYVFGGADAIAHLDGSRAPVARGKSLVVPDSTQLQPDIAFIVLDRAVSGVPIARIRLDAPVKKGESVAIVGFGMTEDGTVPTERRERATIVREVGPFTGKYQEADENEFMFGEAACFGDSGGAAVSTKTNAVIGVASRVDSGLPQTTQRPQAPCVGSDTEDIYTSVSAMKDIVKKAFATAGATPLLEESADTKPPPSSSSTPASSSDDGTEPEAHDRPAPARLVPQPSAGCSIGPTASAHGSAIAGAVAVIAALLLRRGRLEQVGRKRRAVERV